MEFDPTAVALGVVAAATMGGAVLGLVVVLCGLSMRVAELEDVVEGYHVPLARTAPPHPAVHVQIGRPVSHAAAAPESPCRDAQGERAERGGVDVTVFSEEELGLGFGRAPSAFRRVQSDIGLRKRK